MLFWILGAIVVIVMASVFYQIVIKEGSWGFGSFVAFFAAPLLAGGMGLIVMFVVFAIFVAGTPMQHTGQADHDLQALGTGQDIDGRRYFLGSGYMDQEQVFTYVEQDGDAYRLKQADADDSVVYMDEETDPYVTVHEWNAEYWWFAPFSVGHGHTYEFHIPEGSIADSFEVKP